MAHFFISITFGVVVLFVVIGYAIGKENSIVFDVTQVVKDLQNEGDGKAEEAHNALTRLMSKNIKEGDSCILYYQTEMTNTTHLEIKDVINVFNNKNLSSFHPKLLLSLRETGGLPDDNINANEYFRSNYVETISLIANHGDMVVGISIDAVNLEELCQYNKGKEGYKSQHPVTSIMSAMRSYLTSSNHQNLKLGYEISTTSLQCKDHLLNQANADFLVIKIPIKGPDNKFVESYGLFEESLRNEMTKVKEELGNKDKMYLRFNLSLERSLHAHVISRGKGNVSVYDKMEEELLNFAKDELVSLDARTVRRYGNLLVEYMQEWTRNEAVSRKVVIHLHGHPYFEDTDLFEGRQERPETIPYINNFPFEQAIITSTFDFVDIFFKDVASAGFKTMMLAGESWKLISSTRNHQSFTPCNNSESCRPRNILYLMEDDNKLDRIKNDPSRVVRGKDGIDVKSVIFSKGLYVPFGTLWSDVITSLQEVNVTSACQIGTNVFKNVNERVPCKNPNACSALRVYTEFDNRCKPMQNTPSAIIFTETLELEKIEQNFVGTIMNKLDSFVIARGIISNKFSNKTFILQLKGHYTGEMAKARSTTLYCDDNDVAEKIGQFYEAILTWALIHEFPVILEPVIQTQLYHDNPLAWKQLDVGPSNKLHEMMKAGPLFIRRSYNRSKVYGNWTKGMYPCIRKAKKDTIKTRIDIDNRYMGVTVDMKLRQNNRPLSPEEIQTLLLFALGKFSTVEVSLNKDDFSSLKQTLSLYHFDKNLKSNKCLGKTLYLRLSKECTINDTKSVNEIVEEFKKARLHVNVHAPFEYLNNTIIDMEIGQEFENCSNLVLNDTIATMKMNPHFTNLSYIICPAYSELAHNIEEKDMQDYLDSHLYLKKLLQYFYPNLKRIHFRIQSKMSGSAPVDQVANLMMFLSDVNNYAKGYNIHFLLPAFSAENKSQTDASFWKITDYKDLTSLSVYKECQQVFLNGTTWVPQITKDNRLSHILFGIALFIGLILLIMAFIFWKRRSKRLSKLEIQQFHSGHQVTLRKAVDERKNNKYTVNIFDGFVFQKGYELPKEEIALHENVVLGQGKFSTVHLGTLQKVKKIAAVKIANKKCSNAALKGMLSEVKLLCYLGDHINIVRFIGCYTKEIEKGILWIVTEHSEGDSLQAFLRTTRNNNRNTNFIDIKVLIKFCLEIASGMEFLANQKIIHGSLCTSSVLLHGEGNHCKIYGCGGLWRKMADHRKCIKKHKEPSKWQWMAQETLKLMKYSIESDAWSFGVTVWEIFNLGDIPFPKVSWSSKFVDDLEHGMRLKMPLLASDELFILMLECWSPEPKNRPDFGKLVIQLNYLLESEDQN